MLLIPTNLIKLRRAREYCRVQTVSQRAYNFHVSERSVINNKPHIVLKSVPAAPPLSYAELPYMMLGAPLELPTDEEYGDEDEMVRAGRARLSNWYCCADCKPSPVY